MLLLPMLGQYAAQAQDSLLPVVEPAAIEHVTSQVEEVAPKSRDEGIRARLQRILEATGWFYAVAVDLDEGVHFLRRVDSTGQAFREGSGAGELIVPQSRL